MRVEAEPSRASPIAPTELRRLQERSDGRGVARLVIHASAIGVTGLLYGVSLGHPGHPLPTFLLLVAYGFTLVTMFAAMHETVHRTAFASRGLNDTVGWAAGLLSFYNSTFYRYYHGWHHRFTQIPGKDPELEERKPTSFASYVVMMSGVPWWLGKFATYATIAAGKVEGFPYLNEETRPLVVRSVRLQLAVYAAAIALSFLVGEPLFVTYWLLPVAVGQPLLRAILLAEHGGCSETDDPLTNTRTTHTVLPVRVLMWEMPFHAEHHRWPALPFHALAEAHVSLGPNLAHVARHGYLGFHVAFLRSIARTSTSIPGGSSR